MAETVIVTPDINTVVLSLTDITAVGPPGPQGTQGIQGIQGETGPPGPPLNMKGTVTTSSALPGGAAIGDTYITQDTGYAYTWDGTGWVNNGQFVGPQGAQGVQGIQGVQGAAATIVVGSTTTGAAGTPASVVNTGTSSAASFAFTIPQGIQGVQGVQGIQGVAGPTGSQGPIGPTGPPGPPLNMKGTVATASDLPTSGNTIGDMYLALDTGHAWVWSGTAWTDTGPFQGPAGPQGINAITTTSASFTVPAAGSPVSVNVADSTFPAVGEMVYVAGAAGANLAGALQVTSKTTGQVTLQAPATNPQIAVPGTVVPSGSLVTPGGAQGIQGPPGPNAVSANTGNLLTTGTDNLLYLPPSAIQPTIWSARLRSFNAVGNPSFEVDQRNVNGGLVYPAGSSGQMQCDRWSIGKVAVTAVINAEAANLTWPANNSIPGTNFNISRTYLSISVTTPQATLAAGEYIQISQIVEGSLFRELSTDVHSISILCWCNIALNFTVCLHDTTSAYSLVLPCSIPANTISLVTLPNLPIFPSAGNFNFAPGSAGYGISICLGTGTTYQTSTTGSWISGNFLGTSGTTNFMAGANTFQLRFVQHEPSSVCTTLIDKPFTQNLDECTRYYQKSYDYSSLFGSTGGAPWSGIVNNVLTWVIGLPGFTKRMAKVPTVVIYDSNNGAANSMFDAGHGTHFGVSTTAPSQSGINAINIASSATFGDYMQFQFTADTGW